MILVTAFFLTQSVFAYATEENFWKERRQAVADSRSHTRMASLSPVLPLMGKTWEAQSVSNLVHRTNTQKSLPSWMSGLVTPFADVEDFHISPPSKDQPLVLLIQDVHGLTEAQRNISHFLNRLTESYDLRLVGLEGASGGLKVNSWRKAASPKDWALAANFLLDEHLIGGAEHFGLTATRENVLWGAETESTYLANIAAYRRAVSMKEVVQAHEKDLASSLFALKNRVFNEPLKAWDKQSASYRDGRMGLGVRWVPHGWPAGSLNKKRFFFRHCNPTF
jgi:hypothetical protein